MLTIQEREEAKAMGLQGWDRDDADVDFVVSYLHWEGKNAKVLDRDESFSVYLEADGFGDIKGNVELQKSIGWDWSHVRDSSGAAWARMAKTIRDILKAKKAAQRKARRNLRRDYLLMSILQSYLQDMTPHSVTIFDAAKAIGRDIISVEITLGFMVRDRTVKVVKSDPNQPKLYALK